MSAARVAENSKGDRRCLDGADPDHLGINGMTARQGFLRVPSPSFCL